MRRSRLKSPRLLVAVVVNVAYLCLYGVGGATDERPAADGRFAPDAETLSAPGGYARHTPGAPEGATPRVVYYNAREVGQITVSLAEDLALVSESGRRLLFSPIISWTGERADGPKSVHFRFYSVAGASQYDTARGLRVTADGKELWADAAPIYSMTYRAADRVVENLSAQVPLKVFARAAAAGTVKVAVGREEVELSAVQTHALRRMVRCSGAGDCS